MFGVFDVDEASKLTYLGLHALQHRGQESAGIATSHNGELFLHRGKGLVQDVFAQETLQKLPGRSAVGHVRYSTAGGNDIRNAQPIGVVYAHGMLAVAHNGNLTNAEVLRRELEQDGSIFQSTSDTEVLVHLIAKSQRTSTVERVIEALHQVRGAFSLAILTPKKLIAVRDAHGIRPLCLGNLNGKPVVASEPPAIELIGGQHVRDVLPGEMVVIDSDGIEAIQALPRAEPRMCVFEHIYFARPDSTLDGVDVYAVRQRLGQTLAKEAPAQADVVIPVPDSGVAAAMGFAQASSIPFELGLLRSHYVGRTFIEPTQQIRNLGVRLKLSPVKKVLQGRSVAVVDDSIVRGTTSRKIVELIRGAGAREVHLRISSPPTRWPCYYGIDTPSREELIASGNEVESIQKFTGADSLRYLSLQGLHEAVGSDASEPSMCDACFSGNYVIPIPQLQSQRHKRQLSLL